MLNDTTNNYLKACEEWRLKFIVMDKEQLMEKLPELKSEDDYLTLKLFGKKFRVHTQTGEIVTYDDFQAAPIVTRLNIYTLFGFVKPGAQLKDTWVPFRELNGAAPFTVAFEKHVLEPFAETFTGQIEKLSQACEQLGGIKLSHSDAGYCLNSFECIPIKFLFWDGDDEFPAQGNILYDTSATDFIHVESTVSLAIEGIERLAEAAKMPIKGPIFKM